MKRMSLIALAVGVLGAAAHGQFPEPGALLRPSSGPSFLAKPDRISAAAVPQYDQATAGQSFHVAVDVRIGQDWAYYSPAAGKSTLGAEPQRGSLRTDAGQLQVGKVLWPRDEPYGDGTWVYKKRAIVVVAVTVPKELPEGTYPLAWQLGGQVCNSHTGECVPLEGLEGISGTVLLRVGKVAKPGQKWGEAYTAAIAAGRTAEQIEASSILAVAKARGGQRSVPAWLALALLAGLILNIMPCVLPVIPLRIYSVVRMAGESRRRFITLGLAFALGIVLFFAGAAAVNAILKLARGQAFRWSEQWQEPGVIIAMALVLVAVAANLFGLFAVTVPRRIAEIEAREGKRRGAHVRSLGMGLMMAVLGTPCSFGLLLAVLGWAQASSLAVGTLAFLAVGIGMAAPHALLVAFPKLVDYLPRPGAWMELFKQSMGFVLLLVATWVLSWLVEKPYAFWVVGYGVVLAFALWTWGRWVRYDAPLGRKLVVRGLALVLAAGAGLYMLRPPAEAPAWAIKFQPFDESAMLKAIAENRIVVIKFTANWCSSCVIVDWAVYQQKDVADKFKDANVYAVKGDVTTRNSPANVFLHRFASLSVPVSAVYLPGRGEPVLLEGKFDKSELLKLLGSVGG